MMKSNNSKTTAIFIVSLFATILTLGSTTYHLQTALAHYGVDKDKCKDDEDYYKNHENDCDKNLKKHYGKDYNGDFGSKTIYDDSNDDNGNDNDNNDNNNGESSISQGIGQSQSSGQGSEVASGNNAEASGNNLNLQGQENTGNNAAGQK